jgi:hypothetical protein
MARLADRSVQRVIAATKRLEGTPAGSGVGPRGGKAVYPGTCVFGFVATSTITARSGGTPGTGSANIEIVSASTGLCVAVNAVTIKNRYTSAIANGKKGVAYIDGPYLVALGWEC